MKIKCIGLLMLLGVSYGLNAQGGDIDLRNQRNVLVKFTYKSALKEHLDSLQLTMQVPGDVDHRQKVNTIHYSIQPDSTFQVAGNHYAVFRFYHLQKDFKIQITCDITIYKFIADKQEQSTFDPRPYLKKEAYIDVSSPRIMALADSLKKATDIETVINTYFYVRSALSYKLDRPLGALHALETGEGKCVDYSDLFISLLRANKIPCKAVIGAVVTSQSSPLHQWAEVYLAKQGWVLFDPTTTQMDVYQVGNNFKIRQRNQYVILSDIRNDTQIDFQSIFATRPIIVKSGWVKIDLHCEVADGKRL